MRGARCACLSLAILAVGCATDRIEHRPSGAAIDDSSGFRPRHYPDDDFVPPEAEPPRPASSSLLDLRELLEIDADLVGAPDDSPAPRLLGPLATVIEQPGGADLRTAEGLLGRESLQPEPQREPPDAVPGGPYEVWEGDLLVLDGRASTPALHLVGYDWDLDGDGSFLPAEGVAPQTLFPTDEDGLFAPVLRVTDDLGLRHERSAEVRVLDVDPNVRLDAPEVGCQNVAIELDATGSRPGSAHDPISSFGWNFGDGTPGQSGPVLGRIEHVYDRPGNYLIFLSVSDEDSMSATLQRVTIDSCLEPALRGPSAVIGVAPIQIDCGQAVHLDGTGSIRGDRAIVEHRWDLDGLPGFEVVGSVVDFRPSRVGRSLVQLQVTDSALRQDVAEAEIEVDLDNRAPVADAGGPYLTGLLDEGGYVPVVLDGLDSFDPDSPCDGIERYEWDLDGDGVFGEEGELGAVIDGFTRQNWQPDLPFFVQLRVCDTQGLCSHAVRANVVIGAEAPPSGIIDWPPPESCLSGAPLTVRFRVADPEGDAPLNVWLFLGARMVGGVPVDSPADGSWSQQVELVMPFAPEGRHELTLFVDDARGALAEIDGGEIVIDRTPPVVSIMPQLPQDACFAPEHEPEWRIDVDDAIDPRPRVEAFSWQDAACAYVLSIQGTDACGNRDQQAVVYRLVETPEIVIDGPPDGAELQEAQFDWHLVGCANEPTAELHRRGADRAPYPPWTSIDEPGDYLLTVTTINCLGQIAQITRRFTIIAEEADP